MIKNLKICFITEDFYPQIIGGQGIWGYHLVDELSKMGHKVTVLAEKRQGRAEFWQVKKNVRLFLTPFLFGNQLLLSFWEYLIFRFKLGDEYFDIVHASQLSGLFFVLFKPENVNKVIISEWNTHFEMRKYTKSLIKKVLYIPLIFLEKILYSKASGIIFDSPQERKNFKKFLKLKKPQRAIYLGSNRVSFSNKEKRKAGLDLRRQLNLPNNARIVLFIGRLVERKRVDVLLQALKIINMNQIGIYALIIGDGLQRTGLEKMAPANVKFLPFQIDLRKFYLASDVFVTVSQAEGGFLLTALEAAKYGLPLILSDSAAGFPIIKEGRNGYIINTDDYNDLAEKIRLVLKNSNQMSQDSQKLAQQFSWKKCGRETSEFYQNLR